MRAHVPRCSCRLPGLRIQQHNTAIKPYMSVRLNISEYKLLSRIWKERHSSWMETGVHVACPTCTIRLERLRQSIKTIIVIWEWQVARPPRICTTRS